jgi:mono/diheme cytochrome c family protein
MAERYLAEFAESDQLLAAVEHLREQGFSRFDAYTPYPVEGLSGALGFRRSRLPRYTLAGGSFGALLAYGGQWWMNAVDYPINVGGRPAHSAPAFIPITFELTVLCGALATVLGLVIESRLGNLWNAVDEVPGFGTSSIERFWLALDSTDQRLGRPSSKPCCGRSGPNGSRGSRARMNSWRLGTALFWSLAACDVDRPWPPPDPGLERMIDQRRADSFERSVWFPDGKVMRPYPAGTVPHDEPTFGPEIARGSVALSDIPTRLVDRRYEEVVPLPIDRELLALGERRFRVFCAVCHGAEGTGQSVVAGAMSVRKPPSLHEPRIVAFPPGRLFSVVSEGYGLMPSYSLQLDERSRWAIVAEVRKLQQLRVSSTSQLPEEPK